MDLLFKCRQSLCVPDVELKAPTEPELLVGYLTVAHLSDISVFIWSFSFNADKFIPAFKALLL